jgi:hypothetical protein
MSTRGYADGSGDGSHDGSGDGIEGEELVRNALREAAWAVEPSAWPGEAVRTRARRRRRRQRVAVAVPVVAAVVLGAGVLARGAGPAMGTRVGPASGASKPPRPVSPPKPSMAWPPVRVVAADHPIAVGDDQRMKLEKTQACTEEGGSPSWNCKSVADGNQGAGTVSIQTSGDAKGTLYEPLYIGSGRPAAMTVRVGGHTYLARVVTLPGHPGYATGYAWGPPVSMLGANSAVITVYGARGKVLASFGPPG